MSNVMNEEILKFFRDPDFTATDEHRALQLLSRHPRPEQLSQIRDPVVDPNYSQSSLLHYACRNGWYDVSRELVYKYRCDPQLGGSFLPSRTPLHYACLSGELDIVKLLVEECQCDPLNSDDDSTPLQLACWVGNVDVVRFLIHHCDPTRHGWEHRTRTALHYACGSGELDIVKFLVEECHYDPRVKNFGHHTPLHHACEEGSIDVKFLIVDNHCDPACRAWEGGCNSSALCLLEWESGCR